MAEFKEVLKTGDLQDGQMKSVAVEGKEVLLARAGNDFYAASNLCPHMKGRLAKGALKGTIVTCPLHASRFDLKDGHVVRWTNWSGIKLAISKVFRSPRPLPVYRVKLDGDRVLVEL